MKGSERGDCCFRGLTFDSAAGTGAARRWGGPSRSPGRRPRPPGAGWPAAGAPSPAAGAPPSGRSGCRGAAETCCPPRGPLLPGCCCGGRPRPTGGRRSSTRSHRRSSSSPHPSRAPHSAGEVCFLALLRMVRRYFLLFPRLRSNWEGSVGWSS